MHHLVRIKARIATIECLEINNTTTKMEIKNIPSFTILAVYHSEHGLICKPVRKWDQQNTCASCFSSLHLFLSKEQLHSVLMNSGEVCYLNSLKLGSPSWSKLLNLFMSNSWIEFSIETTVLYFILVLGYRFIIQLC